MCGTSLYTPVSTMLQLVAVAFLITPAPSLNTCCTFAKTRKNEGVHIIATLLCNASIQLCIHTSQCNHESITSFITHATVMRLPHPYHYPIPMQCTHPKTPYKLSSTLERSKTGSNLVSKITPSWPQTAPDSSSHHSLP